MASGLARRARRPGGTTLRKPSSQKKAPQVRGVFPVASYGIFQIVRRLFCSASGDELGVDDRKAFGIVTALEI